MHPWTGIKNYRIIFQRIWHYNEETTYLPSWPFTAWSSLWLRLTLLGRRSLSSGVTRRVLLRNGGGVSIFSSMSLPGIETSDKRPVYGLSDGSSVVDDLSLLELEGFLGLSKIISSELLDSSLSNGLSALTSPSCKLSAKRWAKKIIQISSLLKIIWSKLLYKISYQCTAMKDSLDSSKRWIYLSLNSKVLGLLLTFQQTNNIVSCFGHSITYSSIIMLRHHTIYHSTGNWVS